MPENNLLNKQRVSATLVIITIGILTAASASIANFGLYFQQNVSQSLFMGITEAVVASILMFARRLAKKGSIEAAGYLALAISFPAFGAGELVHQGFTELLAICGGLMIILIGLIILPRRFYIWLPALALFVSYFLVVNRLDLFPRYDIRGVLVFRYSIIIVVVLLVCVAVWQFISIIRFGNIRTRLLTTIVVLSLVPTALIGALATYISIQRSIQQTEAQLGSVADLKRNQLMTWIDGVEKNLQLSVPTANMIPDIEVLVGETDGADTEVQESIGQRVRARYQQIITQTASFTEIFLVDLAGKIVLSTDRNHEGRIELGYAYFELGLVGSGTIPPAEYPYTDDLAMIVVAPVYDQDGDQIAILAAQADLSTLDVVMRERAGLGETGESYLIVTKTLQLLTDPPFEDSRAGDYVYSPAISRAGEENIRGQDMYTSPWGVSVIGAYRPIEEMGMVLISEQTQAEAFAPIVQTTLLNALLTTGTVLVAVMISLVITGRITNPIADLASTAEQISKGNLDLEARVEQQDEIGALAEAFNRMTAQLRQTLEGLEKLVQERTATLELRTRYLQASAEVSRAVSSILEPDQLIQEVVELIRDRFDLYYVGLFMLNAERDYAILSAGTGTAGQVMLARQHRIKVGSGMIGWSIANRSARIAQRAELDASRLVNPYLPETRSEAAIPLISRGEVIGALTIQSTQPDIFDPETISVFQVMAEQVAVALENARLFVQNQQSLEALRSIYRDITKEGWKAVFNEQRSVGFVSEIGKAITEAPNWTSEMLKTYQSGSNSHILMSAGDSIRAEADTDSSKLGKSHYLGIPLVVRDNVIGVLGCYKSFFQGEWTEEEISTMKEVGQAISIALESARLYEDTQRRAERERLSADIAARIRDSLDVDSVLQTAVVEIRRALNLEEISIRLGDSNGQSDS